MLAKASADKKQNKNPHTHNEVSDFFIVSIVQKFSFEDYGIKKRTGEVICEFRPAKKRNPPPYKVFLTRKLESFTDNQFNISLHLINIALRKR